MLALGRTRVQQDERRVHALMFGGYCHWCCTFEHTPRNCPFRGVDKERLVCKYQHCRNFTAHGKECCYTLVSHANRVVKGHELVFAVDELACVKDFSDDCFARWNGPSIAALWKAANAFPARGHIERY